MRRPTARPLALRTAPEDPWTGGTSGLVRAAIDSAPLSPLSRISPSHLNFISSQLSQLDLQILDFAARARLCSGDQLQRLFWRSTGPAAARRARRALQRLTEWRVLDRLDRVVGGQRAGSRGFLYSVGPAGARLLDRGWGLHVKRLQRPSVRFVAHTLAISELIVGLHETDRDGRIDLLEVQTEPQSWRGFLGFMGASQTLKPDLLARIGIGAFEDRWFIEIDMNTHGRSALLAKAKRYLAYYRTGHEQAESGVFPRVLWTAPSSRRVGQFAELFAGLGPDAGRLFVVCLQADQIDRLTGGAAS